MTYSACTIATVAQIWYNHQCTYLLGAIKKTTQEPFDWCVVWTNNWLECDSDDKTDVWNVLNNTYYTNGTRKNNERS